jgi:hypothetical protein
LNLQDYCLTAWYFPNCIACYVGPSGKWFT